MKKFLTAQTKYALSRLNGKKWPKLVLFLSDDWGSIRLKNRQSRNKLEKAGLNINSSRFDRYDSLETNRDVEGLMEVLDSFKDLHGNSPLFTMVSNVGNPDFEKISKDNYNQYHVEDLATTYSNNLGSENVPKLIKEGIEKRLFEPALHGREHVRIKDWLYMLKSGNAFANLGFNERFFFIPDEFCSNQISRLEASFWHPQNSEDHFEEEVLKDAILRFEKFFQTKPYYFTPPSLLFSENLPKTINELGLSWMDVPRIHHQNGRMVYLGSRFGQLRFLVRNMVFEPLLADCSGSAESCLKQIQYAFQYGQPAIISNHRVSFAGAIEPENTNKGLKELSYLLKEVLRRWPDIQFIGVKDLEAYN